MLEHDPFRTGDITVWGTIKKVILIFVYVLISKEEAENGKKEIQSCGCDRETL